MAVCGLSYSQAMSSPQQPPPSRGTDWCTFCCLVFSSPLFWSLTDWQMWLCCVYWCDLTGFLPVERLNLSLPSGHAYMQTSGAHLNERREHVYQQAKPFFCSWTSVWIRQNDANALFMEQSLSLRASVLLFSPGAGLPVCRYPGFLQPAGPPLAVAAGKEAARTHFAHTSFCPDTCRGHRQWRPQEHWC